MPAAERTSSAAEKCAHYWTRPQHAVTYPNMNERQKAAQVESVENLKFSIQLQQIRKKSKK